MKIWSTVQFDDSFQFIDWQKSQPYNGTLDIISVNIVQVTIMTDARNLRKDFVVAVVFTYEDETC